MRMVLFLAVLVSQGMPEAASITHEIALNSAWAAGAFAKPSILAGGNRLHIMHDDEPGTAKLNRCVAGGALRLASAGCVFVVGLAGPLEVWPESTFRNVAWASSPRNLGQDGPATFSWRVSGRNSRRL